MEKKMVITIMDSHKDQEIVLGRESGAAVSYAGTRRTPLHAICRFL